MSTAAGIGRMFNGFGLGLLAFNVDWSNTTVCIGMIFALVGSLLLVIVSPL